MAATSRESANCSRSRRKGASACASSARSRFRNPPSWRRSRWAIADAEARGQGPTTCARLALAPPQPVGAAVKEDEKREAERNEDEPRPRQQHRPDEPGAQCPMEVTLDCPLSE